MDIGFFWIALGLAALGYFIGNGIRNFSTPKKSTNEYYLIKESDLHLYIYLSKEETEELLYKYPSAPKIELKGTTYYPYQLFLEWLSSNELYKTK